MSVSIIPYSVNEFNKIPDLADSEKQFNHLNGEPFILDTLRVILFKHNLQHIFGFRLLYKYIDRQEDEKLVRFKGQLTVWGFGERIDVPAENVLATAWKVVKGQGLMPYEFYYRESKEIEGVNLTDSKYQPFLREFVHAVETAGIHDNVALMWRVPKGEKLEAEQEKRETYGETELAMPAGKRVPDDLTVSWCFDPKPEASS